MQMTWRWYGEGNDSVTLKQTKQIPGVEGIVWALHNKAAGEVWEVSEIEEVRKQLERLLPNRRENRDIYFPPKRRRSRPGFS